MDFSFLEYNLKKWYRNQCTEIADDEIISFSNNVNISDNNKTISVTVPIFNVPFIHKTDAHICGALFNIVKEVAIKKGYRYAI